MNGLKTLQCKRIEKEMINALNEVLDVLEYTILDVKEGNFSHGYAKKVANKYIPIMLRNSRRLRDFRKFMTNNNVEILNININTRVEDKLSFFC